MIVDDRPHLPAVPVRCGGVESAAPDTELRAIDYTAAGKKAIIILHFMDIRNYASRQILFCFTSTSLGARLLLF